MDTQKFYWEYNGSRVFAPAFEIVVASGEPLQASAPGFIHFYEVFLRRYAKSFTTYRTGNMTSWRKPSAKALQLLPGYLSDARNLAAPEFGVEFHSAPKVAEMLPPALRADFMPGGSYIAATVPTDILADGPEAALALVHELFSKDFAFTSGWAGLAVAWNESMQLPYGEPRQQLRAWVMRHPGLGTGGNFSIYERALHGIACVNWLTFLGAGLSAKKGGAAALASALGPDVVVSALGPGVCIQAGPVPQLGDVNRGDGIPLYRRVGSHLKDLRTSQPERWLDGPEDDTEAWFGRFDA